MVRFEMLDGKPKLCPSPYLTASARIIIIIAVIVWHVRGYNGSGRNEEIRLIRLSSLFFSLVFSSSSSFLFSSNRRRRPNVIYNGLIRKWHYRSSKFIFAQQKNIFVIIFSFEVAFVQMNVGEKWTEYWCGGLFIKMMGRVIDGTYYAFILINKLLIYSTPYISETKWGSLWYEYYANFVYICEINYSHKCYKLF